MPTTYIEDLTGKKFGKWTVTGYAGSGTTKNRSSRWTVVCECGKTGEASRGNLVRGLTKSCGCTRVGSKHNLRHGMRNTSLYHIWIGIKQRCLNSNSTAWHHYGGRGITVCDGIRNSFEVFHATMGDRPEGMSVDRIDNELGYWCGECEDCKAKQRKQNMRWASGKTQKRNTRVNHLITHNGKTQTLTEWAEETGQSVQGLFRRIRVYGWSVEKSLITPVRGRVS